MSPDHKALVFLGAVAVLGAGVRVSRAASRSVSTPSNQPALDHQISSADSAAAAGVSKRATGRGPKRSSKTSKSRDWSPHSASQDSGQGSPRRKKAEPHTGAGYVNGKLDLDVASAAQIDSLPGVSPTMAKRIAADRMRRGPFLDLDGLRRVSGVGPSLAKHLDSLVTFSGVYTQGVAQDSTIRVRPRKSNRGRGGDGAMRPAALRTRAPPPGRWHL